MELKRKSDTHRYIILEVSDDGSNAGRGKGASWGRASSILHPGIKTLTIQTCLFTCILLIKKTSAIFKLKTFGQKSFTIETSFCKVIAFRMVSNVIRMLLHFSLLSNLNTCIYQVLCFYNLTLWYDSINVGWNDGVVMNL